MPTRSVRSAPDAPRTSTCSAASSGRCSCGAAEIRVSPRRSPTRDFVDLNPSGVPGGRIGRQGNNGTPHNYYSGTDKLWALTNEEAGRPVPLFGYLDPGVLPSGDPGGRADVRMDTDSVSVGVRPGERRLLALDERAGARGRQLRRPGQRERTSSSWRRRTDRATSTPTVRRPSRSAAGTVLGAQWRHRTHRQLDARISRGGHRPVRRRRQSSIELLPGRTWVELADPVDGAPVIS